MLRPILHRTVITLILLATLLAAGVIADPGSRGNAALTTGHAESTVPVPELKASVEDVPASRIGRRGPDHRWPFFSFRNAGGKRSW